MGSAALQSFVKYERMFDTVVRNYSLIGETNGERWIPTLLGETPTIFDVGFHSGETTREVLHVRPRAEVFAFDPSRASRLNYESTLSADPRVHFENVGLSDEIGWAELHDYENMCNSFASRKDVARATGEVYRVPVTTVDQFRVANDIGKIDLMKIDAEGFDLNVLAGARASLEQQAIDIFLFEFASGWASSKRYLWEAFDLIASVPYTLFRLFNGFLVAAEYQASLDSCCTLPAMYVGVSAERIGRGDIPVRTYRF